MCILTNLGTQGGDMPVMLCDSCDMRFSVVWNRNPVYSSIEYCPFCGEEIEEIVDDEDE